MLAYILAAQGLMYIGSSRTRVNGYIRSYIVGQGLTFIYGPSRTRVNVYIVAQVLM